MRSELISICVSVAFLPFSAFAAERSSPNIVFILIDDMGWKDMGCSGSEFYETPNLDALAQAGIRFVNGYSSSPVCAPSRGAIYSGKSPARTKFTTVFSGKSGTDDRLYEVSKQCTGGSKHNQTFEALHRHVLPSSEVLFAEPLRDAGYATGFFGKWHCGVAAGYCPEERGFDVAAGYRNPDVGTGTSGHWAKTFKKYGVHSDDMADDEYVADYLTTKCIDFIKEKSKPVVAGEHQKPFIAVLSHYLVHMPIEAKDELVTHFSEKPKTDQSNAGYAAMLASVDESVGRILSCLDELGISENTLVVFTSDNGGLSPAQTSNYPLLGGKSHSFEAGMRVPLIVRWPGVIEPSSITEERAIGMDFYPTFLDVAGIETPAGHVLDGESLLPILKGEARQTKRQLVFHYPHYTGSSGPFSSVIDGDWKLIRFYNDEKGAYLLFNLSQDEGEQNDLSEKFPERVIALAKVLDERLDSMGAERPTLNPEFDPAAQKLSNRESNYGSAVSQYKKYKAIRDRK